MIRKVRVGGTRRKKAAVGGHRKHTTRRRRRRISGIGDMGGMAERAGGLILGSVAARELNTLGVKMFPSLTPTMSAIMQMGIGLALPKFAKGAFMQNIGDGMIANGGMVLIVSTGLISGINDRMAYRVNGVSNMKVINGTNRLPVVSGSTTRISAVPTNASRSPRFSNFV
jgi:hypothetical protein